MELRWYFLRTVSLAVPWEMRDDENPRGIPIENCFLLQAPSLSSAKKKAERILTISEAKGGNKEFQENGQAYKISLFSVGILNLEQMMEPIESGVEIFERIGFDEVSLQELKSQLLDPQEIDHEIKEEAEKGFVKMIENGRCWGDDFDEL